jgi:cyclophilin family peptidyl-prolyl cis-trans isomerase
MGRHPHGLTSIMIRTITLAFILAVSVPASAAQTKEAPRVDLETNFGTIVLALDSEHAPKTVENFLRYVREGFYDGTILHRVIDGFMIQGGGYTEDYQRKPTHGPVHNESDNGLRNARGTVAMARTSDPHSATAQFFINVADNDFLDYGAQGPRSWGYAVFGRVVEGMDVVDQIRQVATGPGGPFPKDVPQKPVVIERARVEGDGD